MWYSRGAHGCVQLQPAARTIIARIESRRRAKPSVSRGVSRRGNNDGTPTIDVWFLYDDGGLSLLLPHLLRASKGFEVCVPWLLPVATAALNAGVLQRTGVANPGSGAA